MRRQLPSVRITTGLVLLVGRARRRIGDARTCAVRGV